AVALFARPEPRRARTRSGRDGSPFLLGGRLATVAGNQEFIKTDPMGPGPHLQAGAPMGLFLRKSRAARRKKAKTFGASGWVEPRWSGTDECCLDRRRQLE